MQRLDLAVVAPAIHVAVAAAGLAALFAAVPVAFTVVRVVGAACLSYLGVQAIRKRRSLPGDTSPSTRRAYLSGLLTNLLNPKMVTFTIAFLPQFVDPALGRIGLRFAILGAIMIVFEFLVDGAVGGIFTGLGVRPGLDH